MPTMNVTLSDEFARFVDDEVASGEYRTASEVVCDALRLLRRERASREETVEILRQAVQLGLEQAATGRLSSRTPAEILAAVEAEEKKAD